MAGKMGVKTFLVILLMYAWIDEVRPAEVPSKFIGNWQGRVNTASRSWRIFAAITGGPTNSTVGLLHVVRHLYSFCPHKIKLTTEDDKAEDLIETRTGALGGYDGSCPFGKFNFEFLTKDRILMDWIWLNEDGKATDELSTVLERFDDGQLAKNLNKCEPRTPVAKLKKKVDEDKKKKQKRG